MKKIMNKINFAIIGLMVSVPAFADTTVDASGMCELIKKLGNVLNLLRIMAFVGAAFYIAGWAWTYISKGEAKMDDIKKQGIGLLVGFSLLLMVGLVITFLMSTSGMNIIGCPELTGGNF